MSEKKKLQPTAPECLRRIREILVESRSHAYKAVNAAMLTAYWHIGREIVEEEQQGKDRADYGAFLPEELSASLTEEFGKGFGKRSLRYFRQFYLTYSDRLPPIRNAPRSESQSEIGGIRNAPRSELPQTADSNLCGAAKWRESDFESALLDRLQEFLLELGRDLFFVSRQRRITLEGEHFYIDLVFYHRVLRCFLLIDLKLDKLDHADIGQMLTYHRLLRAGGDAQRREPAHRTYSLHGQQ